MLIRHRELLKYLGNLVESRSKEPKDDLISKLCVEQINKGNLEKADAVQVAFLLLVAGNATMVNMINLVCTKLSPYRIPLGVNGEQKAVANDIQGVVELLRNPDQRKELLDNPKLVPKFVEELCRFHTASSMAMKRVAKEDIELGGKVLYLHLPTPSDLTKSRDSTSRLERASLPPTCPETGTRTSSRTRTSSTCTASSRKTDWALASGRIGALLRRCPRPNWRLSSVSIPP